MFSFDRKKSGLRYLLADLLFPNRCPFCDDVINWRERACGKCAASAEYFDGSISVCRNCGRSVCRCGEVKYLTDGCYSAGYYSNELRRAVLALKYHKNENAAEFFSEVIFSQMTADKNTDFDYIVPVPMSLKKQHRRGYNQAEYFAEHLQKLLPETEVRTDLLVKKYSRKEQHDRSAEERKEAVLREYSAAKNIRLNGEKIILCDDILTTGATIDRCADLLRVMGAGSVVSAVCCISE